MNFRDNKTIKVFKEENYMKFIKGMMLGTVFAASVVLMYNDQMRKTKKKMMKTGKKFLKDMGM